MLQYVAVYCSALQLLHGVAFCSSVLQCIAMCCNELQCDALCCSELQCLLSCSSACALEPVLKFSNLSSLLNILYNLVLELTFQNLYGCVGTCGT